MHLFLRKRLWAIIYPAHLAHLLQIGRRGRNWSGGHYLFGVITMATLPVLTRHYFAVENWQARRTAIELHYLEKYRTLMWDTDITNTGTVNKTNTA